MGAILARVAMAVAVLGVAAPGCGGSGPADLPCTFTEEDDGSRRMDCPDGTSALFPPAVASPRTGAVSGSASLFGEPRRDGLDVWLILAPSEPGATPLSRHAATDEEGRFRFDDVPPGVHRVSVRAPGYRSEDREVVVDPGEYVLPPVVLRRGQEALTGDKVELYLSPRGDSFLARYGRPSRRLVFWEPGGAGMVPLGKASADVGAPYFHGDGGLVHFLDTSASETDKSVFLMRYEVDSGELFAVDEGVTDFSVSPGGERILLHGKDGEIRAWNRRFAGMPGGGVRTVAVSAQAVASGPDLRLLTLVVGGSLVVWDMEHLTGDSLGPWGGWARFSPDGSVLVTRLEDRLLAWDAEGPRAIGLGPGSDPSFHDSGRRFVYLAWEGSSRRLVHVDLDGGARPVTLRDRVETVSYGPGAGGIAWVEAAGELRELFLAREPGAAPTSLGRGADFSHLTWSRDGRRLFFLALDGEAGMNRLDVYEADVGVHTLAVDVVFPPLPEPGGEGVFFLVPAGEGVAIDYWDPATDAVIRVHPEWGFWMGLEALVPGPGSRLLIPEADGRYWRWDPATGTTVFLGWNRTQPDAARFLPDGAVLFVDDDRRLWLLEPQGTVPRQVGVRVPGSDGAYASPVVASRFSYRHAVSYFPSGPGTLVLFDREADRAIPLDDGVLAALQGNDFVAYLRAPSASGGPERLFLVAYPPEPR